MSARARGRSLYWRATTSLPPMLPCLLLVLERNLEVEARRIGECLLPVIDDLARVGRLVVSVP